MWHFVLMFLEYVLDVLQLPFGISYQNIMYLNVNYRLLKACGQFPSHREGDVNVDSGGKINLRKEQLKLITRHFMKKTQKSKGAELQFSNRATDQQVVTLWKNSPIFIYPGHALLM